MSVRARLERWAASLKRDIFALYLGARDPRVPWAAKLLATGIAAYALSPIDLIPDFIPVIGYLDDLILLPLGIALVVRMIPPALMHDLRRQAEMHFAAAKPLSRTAAGFIITIWISIGLALGYALLV